MNRTSTLAVSAAALALILGSAANATTVGAYETSATNAYAITYGKNSFAINVAPSLSFSDTYSIVAGASTIDGAVLNFVVPTLTDISGFKVKLFDATTNVTTVLPSVFNATPIVKTLNPTNVYELIISGTAGSGVGGIYDVTAKVSAVPIPAALPLFGSAIAGVGFFAGRRRNKTRAAV